MMEGRLFQAMVNSGNEAYEARKRLGVGAKGSEANEGGGGKVVVVETRREYATQAPNQPAGGATNVRNLGKDQTNRKEQANDAIATMEAIKNTPFEELSATVWEAYKKSLGGIQTFIKGQQIELEAHAQREAHRLRSLADSGASTPTP